MALTLPIGLTDGGVAISSAVSCVESCLIQFSEPTPSVLVAFSVSDSCGISIADASPVVANSLSVTDSARAGLTESTPVVIDPNTASFSTSDSLSVSIQDAVSTVAVSSSVSDSGPLLSDSITNLQVFTGNSTQQFSVTDSLVVRVNGLDQPAPTIPVSVTDSLSVTLTDAVQSVPAIALPVTDSMRVSFGDAGRAPSVALNVTDSASVAIIEPDDQLSHFGVIDSTAVQLSDSAPVIAGGFVFTVSDSASVAASEGLPSFGQVSVGAVESLRAQVSEALTASKSLSVSDSLTAQLSDIGSTARSIFLSDACTVQLTDAATPIFNDFVAITASDTCRAVLSESVTELISFLIQIQTSDSCAVASAEASLFGSSSVSAEDIATLSLDTQTDALVTGFIADSLRMGTTEAGLAIPIVPVSITVFTGDDCAIGVDDLSLIQYNMAVEELCAVGAEESGVTRIALAGSSPDTWNGSIDIEHRNEQPRPGRFTFSMKVGW